MEPEFQQLIRRIQGRFPLTPVPLDPELAEPRSFLRILKARHYNWQAPGFRKIFGMRFDVKIPSLEQMNLILYPETHYATPIFLMFCLLTGRKVICHVNLNGVADDPEPVRRWIQPLVEVQARFGSFECADRYPEWMLRWRTPAGIYGMFPRDRFADFIACGTAYLDHYLEQAALAPVVTDPAQLAAIQSVHARFVGDIRTQDKAQGMMAKMIGAQTARRIFYEVTT